MKATIDASKKQEYITKVTLTGVFLGLFTAFVSRPGIWRRRKDSLEIKPLDLLLLAFATLRLGRLVSYDKVAEPFREPFAQTVPDPTGAGMTVEPRGEGVQQSIGQLISCPICAGTWISAALVYGLGILPGPTRVFLAIMGSTGMAEVLNALTEALSWVGQAARRLAGSKDNQPFTHLFQPGGNYYVRPDHEKYYRQS